MASTAKAVAQRKPVEEHTFSWVGTDRRGTKVKGELRGPNVNVIRAEIRRQGITPLKVRKKPKPLFTMGGAVTPQDIAMFTRQLHTMLTAGIPLVQAIDLAANSGKKEKLKKLLQQIRADVESGTSFSVALEKHSYYFDNLYCKLVKAGEESGVLESILGRIATHLEKIESIKAKVKKAMLYPAIVMLVAFAVTALIMIFVIPVFEDLFRSFGADLPAFTQLVINISQLVREYWWIVLGAGIGGIMAFLQAQRRSRRFQQLLDRLKLKLPVFGNVARLSATARFSRTLATMFDSGVPLVDGLAAVAGATGNIVYENAVMEMRDSVSVGQQLNFTMRQAGLFPDMVVQMVAIGEDSGALGAMLNKVADYFEEELDNTISMLMTLIEPAVMVILGVLIGGLVIAMYLPIFKMAMAV